jgi:hypothetical protein
MTTDLALAASCAGARAEFHRVALWDPRAETTMIMARPDAEPLLFERYFRGAVASYARFGVSDAIESDLGRFAADTAVFWALTDLDGEVVGGVRAKGPLRGAQDSHALIEWAGQPGERAVKELIDERSPAGVFELKSAWLSKQDAGGGMRHRARMIARCGLHAMAAFDVDYCMATSAEHVLRQWCSSGALLSSIPATPYPDERYQTKMLWWDRRTFTVHGEPEQVAAIDQEMELVRRSVRRRREPALAPSAGRYPIPELAQRDPAGR